MKGFVINKGEGHTFLKDIFAAMENQQINYNWLITDHECYPKKKEYADKLSGEWCWLSGEELTAMIEDEDFQWIWGVLSAIPKCVTKEEVLSYELPRAEGNERIWKNPVLLQHFYAVTEIIAWDSSMTILITKNDDTIDILRRNISLVEDLNEYNVKTHGAKTHVEQLLYSMKNRPGMFMKEERIDYIEKIFMGYCAAKADYLEKHDINRKFFGWFVHWLFQWIKENVDSNYRITTFSWAENIKAIAGGEEKEIPLFYELCEKFFDDYRNRRGYFADLPKDNKDLK